MGRRSRKKGAPTPRTAAPPRPSAPRSAPASRPKRPITASAAERPPAPWHPLPVTEVAIFVGAIAMLIGFVQGREGLVLTLVGFAVCGLAVLELAAREHFAGFRSHALLLALGPVVVLEGALFFAGISGPLLLAIALPAFAALAYLLRQRYKEQRDVRPR